MDEKRMNLIGMEVEYKCHEDDTIPNYVDEYYDNMREVNRILIPTDGGIKQALQLVRNTLYGINNKLGNTLGTYGWNTSYGYAFNGLHLHLSMDLNVRLLEKNILKALGKWGLTPRVVTSWHCNKHQSYEWSLKVKRKYCPIYKTPRGTIEIRNLDIEYFYDDEILDELGVVIETTLAGKEIDFGDASWYIRDRYNEDTGGLLNTLEANMVPWYKKVIGGAYHNMYTKDTLDFNGLMDRHFDLYDSIDKYDDELPSASVPVSSLSITKLPEVNIPTPDTCKMPFKVLNSIGVPFKVDIKDSQLFPFYACAMVETWYQGDRILIPNDLLVYTTGMELEDVAEDVHKEYVRELQELLKEFGIVPDVLERLSGMSALEHVTLPRARRISGELRSPSDLTSFSMPDFSDTFVTTGGN